MPANTPELHIIPAYSDNYIYLLEWEDSTSWVIDPGQAAPVDKLLNTRSLKLTSIFLTHRHWDHVNGVKELKETHNAEVWGPAHIELPFVASVYGSKTPLPASPSQNFELSVFSSPGHTQCGHCLVLRSNDETFLFCGDTLFSGGCGRLTDGTAEQMLTSLNKIKALPKNTRVCCGHEYTKTNYSFAFEKLNWKQSAIQAKLASLREPSLPVSLNEELELNPFLNCQDESLKKSLGFSNSAPELEVFTKLRELRNNY